MPGNTPPGHTRTLKSPDSLKIVAEVISGPLPAPAEISNGRIEFPDPHTQNGLPAALVKYIWQTAVYSLEPSTGFVPYQVDVFACDPLKLIAVRLSKLRRVTPDALLSIVGLMPLTRSLNPCAGFTKNASPGNRR